MNWTRGICGRGAIDQVMLVMHLHRREFKEALLWLEQHFPAAAGAPSAEFKTSLQLPVPVPQQLGRVQDYLANERFPDALTEPLINTGLLFAGSKANAVIRIVQVN